MQMISLLGFQDTLAAPMDQGFESVMTLTRHNTGRFIDRLRGQSTVLVISSPTGSEAVEVYSPDGMYLVTVQRGVDGSPVVAHPAGACVEFQGLPVNPCVMATAICESEQATATLRECLTEEPDIQALIEAIRSEPARRRQLALVVADALCDTVEVRQRFINCLAATGGA